MSFSGKLAEGRAAEEYISFLFERAGYSPRFNPGASLTRRAAFDLVFDFFGRQIHLEAKLDAMASKTGNIAIEYWNPRSQCPSGIYGTSAELWVQVFINPLAAYIARTADIRQFLQVVTPLRVLTRVGDGNADIKLYRLDDILPAVFFGLDATAVCELPRLLHHLVLERG